ncbi:hypothetical protein BWD42_07235 [Sphingobacterium sp. CZ-UAM]|nr:hypothetical protein BWD42_07235 [Sphingobacterium sp. CZ-UAM]
MAQTKQYTIISAIPHVQDSTFNMTIWNGPQTRAAQGKIRNGQIYYQDTTSSALVIRLTLPAKKLFKRSGGGYIPVKSQSIWLIATPGSTIQLNGHLSDFAEVYPNGDRENEVLASLTKIYHPLLNASANIKLRLNQDSDKMDSLEIKKLQAEQEQIDAEAKQVMEAFLKKNPSSIAGLYYMNDMLLRNMITVDFVRMLLPEVDKQYKDSPYYTTVVSRVDGNRYQAGHPMLILASPHTFDGVAFSTAQWAGKFYLVDFWGSWCSPCIADFPAVRRLRDTYPDDLHVLGIALDKEAAWRNAVEYHALDFPQILNGSAELDFVARLNVTGFPTKILVDPNGKIVYRTSGGGEKEFAQMAAIIKKWKDTFQSGSKTKKDL